MLHIANPIYDVVFKYLLEDERITKVLLSALLKKEVVDFEMRRNEYTNASRDGLSIFRIDFGAKVREADGSIHLVLIELQKTWVETETLRFRQYLGAHYANPENIAKENNEKGYAVPMVTVYLLGHKVGDIEEPILYIRRKAYDYDDNEVTKGIPDPFVESLTHDSIIVQIPYLKGRVNNRLEQLLNVFDQSRKEATNRQVLNVDEELFADDEEIQMIYHRLLKAASDSELRHSMNVEDEYFSAIETRDTAIMMRDQKLAEQGAILKEQGEQLKEQGAILKEQDEQLKEQGEQLKEQGEQLKEQEEMLRTTVRMLVGAGMSPESVAVSLGKELDLILLLLS